MTMREELEPIVPFLKWAGGKRWFASQALELLPEGFDRYVEPFLGGGAVYFSVRPERAILGDLNPRLIETYQAIRENWRCVYEWLVWHQNQHSNAHYYLERARNRKSVCARAAQFIYLNRTCWNGLYRVNRAGQFNVPIGTKTSVLLDTDQFEVIAAQLLKAELACGDFADILARCKSGDVVFVDPPYTVKHNLNGFVKYNEVLFSWQDQLRLRDEVGLAVERGAKVIVTNADHPSIRDLYRGIGTIQKVSRSSVLAASPKFRAHVSELVITTWT